MKIDPPPVQNAHKAPCPSVPPLKGGGTVGQQGGFVPWDTRGTAWDSGTAPAPTTIPASIRGHGMRRKIPMRVMPPHSPHNRSTRQPPIRERIQTMTTANQTASQPAPRTAAALMHRPGLSPEIQQARIRFAEKWGLRKRGILLIREPRTERGEEWSHPEAFRDWHGRIVRIVHNYGSPPPSVLGMQMVGCLLREDMQSYAGTYSTTGELRARTEAAGGGEKFSAVASLFREPPTPRRSRLQGRGRATA